MRSKGKVFGLIEVVILIRMIISFVPFVNFHCPEIIKLGTLIALYSLLLFSDKRFWSNILYLSPIFIIDILSFTYIRIYDVEHQGFILSLYAFMRPMSWALYGLYAINNYSQHRARVILQWFSMFLMITAATTCFGCTVFPNASRLLATGMSEDPAMYAVFMSYNIGGFTFVYTLLLLTPLLIYAIREKVANKFFCILMLLLVLVTIISTEYTTALLFFIFSLTLFILPKKMSVLNLFAILFIVLLLYILLKPLIAAFFYQLANVVGSEQISLRLNDVAMSLSGAGVDDTMELNERVSRVEYSWQLFKENILIGTGTNGGGHSFVADNLARYGLIGLLSEIWLFRRIYTTYIAKRKSGDAYVYFFFVLIIQLGLAIFNPILFYEPFILAMPLFYVSYVKKM